MLPITTTCIICGCDDFHACVDSRGEPCSWFSLDMHGILASPGEFGLCSDCIGIDRDGITQGFIPVHIIEEIT